MNRPTHDQLIHSLVWQVVLVVALLLVYLHRSGVAGPLPHLATVLHWTVLTWIAIDARQFGRWQVVVPATE